MYYKRPLITNKTQSEFKELISKLNTYKGFYDKYDLSIKVDEEVNVEINIVLKIKDKNVILVGIDIDDMKNTVDNFFLGLKTSKLL